MVNQRPTLDITHSNQYLVQAQVNMVKSHVIQSARNSLEEVDDFHQFESAAECFQFIDSFLADNKYLFPIAEHVEGGVRGANPTQNESKAANE
jgi:hypothetical protein